MYITRKHKVLKISLATMGFVELSLMIILIEKIFQNLSLMNDFRLKVLKTMFSRFERILTVVS